MLNFTTPRKMRSDYYVYIFLDPRKPGKWEYNGIIFDFQPFYVGKGTRYRMNSHFYNSSRKAKNLKNNVIKAIEESGLEVIRQKIFTGIEDQEAKYIEIDIILKFGRIDIGTGFMTNHTNGGEGTSGAISEKRKEFYQYSLEGNFIQSFESGMAAAKATGVSPYVKWEKGWVQSGGFQWFNEYQGESVPPVVVKSREKSIEKRGFKLHCFDENWELIKEYRSFKEAERDSGAYSKAILRSILTNTLHKNMYWAFPEDADLSSVKLFRPQKIYHYNSEGNFVKMYESRAEFQKETGILEIERYLTGKYRFPMNFRLFTEDQGEKIRPLKDSEMKNKIIGMFNNLDDPEPLKIFYKRADAARFLPLNLTFSRKSIRLDKACLEGTQEGGFYWKILNPID